MRLIELVSNVDSSTKTRELLNIETAKLLKYTFAESDDHPIRPTIIDEAVVLQLGEKLIYTKNYRQLLISSLTRKNLAEIGFRNLDEAKNILNNPENFFNILGVEDEFKKEVILDDRLNYEILKPIHNTLLKINGFPHSYQKRIKSKIIKYLINNVKPKVLATMPTGGGKTVLALEAVVDFLRVDKDLKGDSHNILWVVNSKELCEQSLLSFKKIWLQRGDYPIIIQRFYDKFDSLVFSDSQTTVTFATFDLLNARISNLEIRKLLKETSLLIIDEAHFSNAATYREIIEYYKDLSFSNCRILGLTATPYRLDDSSSDSLRGMFNELVSITDDNDNNVESPIDFLVDLGYLARIDFHILNVFSESRNSTYYKNLHEAIVNSCMQLINRNENTIIYAESKSHAIALSILLNQNGIENGLIVGETPNSLRKNYIEKLGDENSSLNVLVNHQILSTGIDVPGLNSIMILGDINSPTLTLQILGRAMRGELNQGNEVNTVYLTPSNRKRIEDFKLLEYIVLNN